MASFGRSVQSQWKEFSPQLEQAWNHRVPDMHLLQVNMRTAGIIGGLGPESTIDYLPLHHCPLSRPKARRGTSARHHQTALTSIRALPCLMLGGSTTWPTILAPAWTCLSARALTLVSSPRILRILCSTRFSANRLSLL